MELEFDRIIALKKINRKKEQELQSRIDSLNNPEKKRILLLESLELSKSNSTQECLKLGEFSFDIENVSYFDSQKDKLVFDAQIITLDEWFNRELAK